MHRHPHLEHPDPLIAAGEVLVNGFPRTNLVSLVAASDTIALRVVKPLRGTATLTHALRVWLITMDLSYLSIAGALPQLDALTVAPGADLIALVTPAYELTLRPPRRQDGSQDRAGSPGPQ